MRIGLLYNHDPEVIPIVRQMETALRELGHEVEVDYLHQADCDKNGWMPAMMRVLQDCQGFLAVESEPSNDEYRGINEELGLAGILKRPIARTPLESWTDLSPEDIKANCDSLVWYLEQKGA